MYCDCQTPVVAFPALSLHSRANDVFWVSVCLPSKAKSTFLNGSCKGLQGALLRGEEVTLPLQRSHF